MGIRTVVVARRRPQSRRPPRGRAQRPQRSGLPGEGTSVSFTWTNRDRECEGRARAQLTLYPDPAPVQLDELPTQRQSQPGAFYLLRRRPHLTEFLEHFLLILWGNTNPRVADRDLHRPILWHCADFNAPTLGRELDRIGQEVQNDLTDLALIPLNLSQPLIDVGMKCDRSTPGPLSDQHQRVVERRRDMKVCQIKLHPPRLDLGEVEDVVDQRE